MNNKISVRSKELGAEVGYQWISEEVEKISKAIEDLKKTRVTNDLLVALVHDDTDIAKGTIRNVLLSIQALEKKYLNGKGK